MAMSKRDRAVLTAKQVYDIMEAAYLRGAQDALWAEKIPAWGDDMAREAFRVYMAGGYQVKRED